MQIKQAFTYRYDQKHFQHNIEHEVTEAGACFRNVKGYCKTYEELGRNCHVSLVFGLRTWDSGCSAGYHYLVKDASTGEYSDPQYSRYTFVELHSWSLSEYMKECEEFEALHKTHPAEEFAYHYVREYKKQLSAALKFIKAQGHCKLSDAEIKEICYTDPLQHTEIPKYGKKEIEPLNIG